MMGHLRISFATYILMMAGTITSVFSSQLFDTSLQVFASELPTLDSGTVLFDLNPGKNRVELPADFEDNEPGPIPNPVVGGPCFSLDAGFKCNYSDNNLGTTTVLEVIFENNNDDGETVGTNFDFEFLNEARNLQFSLMPGQRHELLLYATSLAEDEVESDNYEFIYTNTFIFDNSPGISAPIDIDVSIVEIGQTQPEGVIDNILGLNGSSEFFDIETGIPSTDDTNRLQVLPSIARAEPNFAVRSFPEPSSLLATIFLGLSLLSKKKLKL